MLNRSDIRIHYCTVCLYFLQRRGVRSPDHQLALSHRHNIKVSNTSSPVAGAAVASNGFHRGAGSPRRNGSHSPRGSPCNGHSPPFLRRCGIESGKKYVYVESCMEERLECSLFCLQLPQAHLDMRGSQFNTSVVTSIF